MTHEDRIAKSELPHAEAVRLPGIFIVSKSTPGEFAMKTTEMILKPIGVIRSPYKTKSEASRQGRLVQTLGTIEIFPEYIDGLKDIELRSHVILIYWFHQAE
ncbi:MAG: TrmO family methyltransferase [Promethearchaeota archaeon]